MKSLLSFFIFFVLFISKTYSQNTIVFSEDFEISTKYDLLTKWDEISNLSGMTLSSEKPALSTGSKSLMIVYNPKRNTGGHLFKTLEQGYNQLFVRFYCKFSTNHTPLNQFLKLGGYNPLTKFTQNDFNLLPNGNDRFSAGPIVRSNFGFWNLSANWMGMKVVPDTILLTNQFYPYPPALANTNKWYCVEFMVKLNEPVNSSNGELALWIDGKKIIHLGQGFPNGFWEKENFYPSTEHPSFEGFQWRNYRQLNINYFWLLYYLTDGISDQRDTLWIDDIIIATNYIGPIGGSNIFQTYKSYETHISYNSRTNSIVLDGLEPDEFVYQMKLYNLLGQCMLDLNNITDFNSSFFEIPLNINYLDKGLYFIYLKSSKREFYTKFILAP